jgi:hypothetical protein
LGELGGDLPTFIEPHGKQGSEDQQHTDADDNEK